MNLLAPCRFLAKYRRTDGRTVSVVGFGPDLYKATVDAFERARQVLCPRSETPGYDLVIVKHRVGE